MANYGTSSSSLETRAKLSTQEKPMQEVLRRAMLSLRNRNVLASLLVGMTTIWLILEIVEYSLATLFRDISITMMLALLIWTTFVYILKGIISGKISLRRFLLITVSLYMLSVIESYYSYVNWLHVGLLCILMLPIVYKWNV